MRGPRHELAVVVLAGLALGACRGDRATRPPVHLNPNMDDQAFYQAQEAAPQFADRRAMRPQVAHTIARGELRDAEHFYRGTRRGRPAADLAVRLDRPLLARGRQRFEIYCAPCHGLAGAGDGIVAVPADRLQEGTWVPPSSLHAATVLARPVGHLFNSITNGIRTMPSYGSQIPVSDRWAIVAYVRALQRSRHTPSSVLTAEERAKLVEVAP